MSEKRARRRITQDTYGSPGFGGDPPNRFMNVVLIGYRGSGKTTIAQIVADQLGWEWRDADDLVESRAGKSIREIFEDDGESTFRDYESQVVQDLCDRERTVVALGGGAILREQNRRAVQQSELVIWLKVSPTTVEARIKADPTTAQRRPNLTSAGGLEEIRALLAERTHLYQEVAHESIDTDGSTPEQIAEQVVAAVKRTG